MKFALVIAAALSAPAFATVAFQVEGRLTRILDNYYVISSDENQAFRLDTEVDTEMTTCAEGSFQIVKANPMPNSSTYVLLNQDCQLDGSMRRCAKFVMAQPMFNPQTGDCRHGGDGCQVADLEAIGYRRATYEDRCSQ
jgi:hypothetical protein